jgi:hypothetical protein
MSRPFDVEANMKDNNENYNGSSEILGKIDTLLDKKTITTSSALRIMLESQQYAIKENHLLRGKIKTLEDHWTNKVTPRLAAIVFIILYSFSISDIRKPFFAWLGGIVITVIKLL